MFMGCERRCNRHHQMADEGEDGTKCGHCTYDARDDDARLGRDVGGEVTGYGCNTGHDGVG